MTYLIGEYSNSNHNSNPRSPEYEGDTPEATDYVRALVDRFGPVEVEYEVKTAKVVGVTNSAGKDIYWLLDRDERLDLDYLADEAWDIRRK
jgi:hypothetical protein